MSHQQSPAISDALGMGDHAAYFFRDNHERLAFAVPYIVTGLRNRERCVYIADENTVSQMLAEFQRAGVDIGRATSTGALSVVTKQETYLRHGIFEPEQMISDLDRDVRFALHRGFSGLRVTGEMSWALDLPSAVGRLCQYEQELSSRWPFQLGGLCQYNETLFPKDVVDRMTACHCVVVRNGQVIRHHVHDCAAAAA